MASPELDLLVACARSHWPAPRVEHLRSLIAPSTDWAAVLRRAQPHGMVPLLAHNLTTHASDRVPAATLGVLQALLDANRQRNQILSQTLFELLGRLQHAGIRVLPFKGLPLAAAYFGDPALRQTGDLDLLVPKHQAIAAHNVLAEAGFRRFNPLVGASEPLSTRFPRNELSFVRDDPGVAVDLHWQFLPRYYFFTFDFDTLWQGRQDLTLDGRTIPGLANEALLLMLAAHGAKHFWPRFQWLADLEAVVAAGIDWPGLWRLAEQRGGRRLLLLGLALAQDLLGLELPQEAHRKIASEAEIASTHRAIVKQLEAPTFRAVRRIAPSSFVQLRERRRDRARVALYHGWLDLKLAFTPSDADRALLPLPRPLHFLYAIVRPMRLLAKHGLRPLKPLARMLVPSARKPPST